MSAFTDRVYRNLLRSFGSQTAMAASKPATRRGYGGITPMSTQSLQALMRAACGVLTRHRIKLRALIL